MNISARLSRILLGIVIPVVLLGGPAVLFVLFRDELPARLATHYDFSGTPDDSMGHTSASLVFGGLIVAGILLLIWLAIYNKPMPNMVAPMVSSLGGFIAGLGAAIAVHTILAQRGLQNWSDAEDPGLWMLPIVVFAFIAAAGCGFLAAKLDIFVGSAALADSSKPLLKLSESENALWVSTVHIRWLGLLCAVALAVAVVTMFVDELAIAALIGLSGLPLLVLSRYRVMVGKSGFVVGFGFF